MIILCAYLLTVSHLPLCSFFFFKQKTAYEMRISDWSSDVCSSDLDDIIADHHGFTHTSRQYQHRIVLHGLPSVFKPLGNETILTGIPPACGHLRDGR